MCTLAHYPVFPARICVGISLAVCHFRLYHLELLKRGKCFVVVLVYAHTDSGAFGGTYRAVGIIQFDDSSRHTGQCLAEQRAEEHISLACMNFLHGNAHLFHDVDSIFKGKTMPSCAARMICCLPCWLKLMP